MDSKPPIMSKLAPHHAKPRGIFEAPPNPWIRGALERTWYIMIPFIGIWLGEAHFVKPNVTAIQNEGIIARLKNEAAGRKLLNEMNASESVIRGATFERDSLLAPAISRRVFLVDSLRAVARAETAKVVAMSASIDSLQALMAKSQSDAVALAESITVYQAQKSVLEGEATALVDSLAGLREQIQKTKDRVKALQAGPKPKPARAAKPGAEKPS